MAKLSAVRLLPLQGQDGADVAPECLLLRDRVGEHEQPEEDSVGFVVSLVFCVTQSGIRKADASFSPESIHHPASMKLSIVFVFAITTKNFICPSLTK